MARGWTVSQVVWSRCMRFSILVVCSIGLAMPAWAEKYKPSAAEVERQKAYKEWELGLAQYLAGLDDPMVNVLASGYLDIMGKKQPALNAKAQAVRAKAWQEGQANAAVILRVYSKDCARGQAREFCDAEAVRNRLLNLDPNNAAVVLLPWLFPADSSAVELQLTAQNVALLVEASRMDTFNLHVTAGMYDAYQAIGQYPNLNDQPPYPQEVLDLMSEMGWQMPQDPRWEPSAAIISSAFHWPSARHSTLINFCRLAQSENHEKAIEACLDLGDVMQDSARTFLEEIMGYALRKVIERPDYIGAAKENLDPQRWRDQVRHLEYDCARPRLLFSMIQSYMPAGHWSAYFRDLQESGEIVASQRAAAREFAQHPEAYVMNPAECARIHELNEETQQRLAEEQEIRRLENTLRYLEPGSNDGIH